jgi:hypothetical protein
MVAAADRGCCEYDFNNGDGERDLLISTAPWAPDLGCRVSQPPYKGGPGALVAWNAMTTNTTCPRHPKSVVRGRSFRGLDRRVSPEAGAS